MSDAKIEKLEAEIAALRRTIGRTKIVAGLGWLAIAGAITFLLARSLATAEPLGELRVTSANASATLTPYGLSFERDGKGIGSLDAYNASLTLSAAKDGSVQLTPMGVAFWREGKQVDLTYERLHLKDRTGDLWLGHTKKEPELRFSPD
jgi:hypothetical protein